jgi:hypothetical protein
MSYFLSAAGVRLRQQIDRKYPKRDKRSDGWIGDSSHAATASDHNPCWTCTGPSRGVVRAIDIDADLVPKAGNHAKANELADELRRIAKNGESRISYIIWNKRIASPTQNWVWRSYSGANDHTHHIHVSFTPAGDKNGHRFKIDSLRILGK